MEEANGDNKVMSIVEDGMSTLRTVATYAFLPVALPLVILQEIIKWVRRKVGGGSGNMDKKVVLITGASSGIGESLAHHFYDAGCRLILVSRRKAELERVKSDLVRRKTNGMVYVPVVLKMDLGDIKSIPAKAATALGIYDTIHILINNAGMSNRGSVLETDISVDVKIMDVNYFGTLALTKAVVNHMVERKSGHVVFMSSVQGKISIPHRASYAASKHALQALADSLRAEVADKNVYVTVISPGYVKTNLSLNALTSTGSTHGEMDSTTAGGYSTDYVAQKTFQAVVHREKDVVICQIQPKIALFLRYMFPVLYFYVMAKRARSGK